MEEEFKLPSRYQIGTNVSYRHNEDDEPTDGVIVGVLFVKAKTYYNIVNHFTGEIDYKVISDKLV